MQWSPVLTFELITTARRGRYYAVRGAYGLVLLYTFLTEYERMVHWDRQFVSIKNMGRFAESAFIAFAWGQGLVLLALIPAMVAGVMADEHQRKTLHYLLASQLSSSEIVLGKLGARLLHAGVFVLMGLPIVCLIGMYGGLDPWNVAYVYAGTFSIALFLSGLSMLVSVAARRPREAILMAYGWRRPGSCCCPSAIGSRRSSPGRSPPGWCRSANGRWPPTRRGPGDCSATRTS